MLTHSHERCHATGQAAVLVLVDLAGQGDEGLDHRRHQFVGVEPQLGERLGQLGRMDTPWQHRPALFSGPRAWW